MKPDKPLPCPFCGKSPWVLLNYGIDGWLVRCSNKRCCVRPETAIMNTSRNAVRRWNRRTR